MLGSEYALKYSMPHSVVHIVDNSMYAGELPTVVADDPSLYATLVVTGAPMGPDNEIISINRSDILNVAFGMNNLSPADIKKYGQTVTYPASLLDQNAPIKFMRVTPEDSTYAFSCLLVQWRWDVNMMHVRFKTTSGEGNSGLPAGVVHSSFKNIDRLNSVLVNRTEKTFIDSDGTVWQQRVFMTEIAAGRGKNYNFYNYTIDLTNQSRRPANTRYLFATVDTRVSQVVEQFFASLINENNSLRADAINSVNVEVGKRVKGSSILVPKVNETAIKELYAEYMEHLKDMIDNDIAPSLGITDMAFVQNVYKTMSINIFEPIFGRYIYEGDTDVKLPYYQVDMVDLDIPQLSPSNRIKTFLGETPTIKDYEDDPTDLQSILDNVTYGITNANDAYHVGDVFCDAPTSLTLNMITSINQFTGAVTYIPISQVVIEAPQPEPTPKPGVYQTFSGFTTLKKSDTTTAEAAKNAIETNLINKGKLKPTMGSDGLYKDDYVIIGTNDVSATNKLSTFVIAVVTYTETGTVNTVTLLQTKAEIYNKLRYPDSIVTGFALAGQTEEKNPQRFLSGTTVLGTDGSVKVNKYVPLDKEGHEQQFEVVNETPFVVGSVPNKVTVDTAMVGTIYDNLIYQTTADGSLTVKWKITGGTAKGGTGYSVGDIVKLDVTPNTYFQITSAVAGTTTQDITVARFMDSAGSPDQLTAGEYDTVAGYVYRKLAETPVSYTNIYMWDTATCTFVQADDTSKYGYYEKVENDIGTGLKINVTAANISAVTEPAGAAPAAIQRYNVTGTQGSLFRYQKNNTDIPTNYYSDTYGINPSAELGGVPVENGYAGFFDDDINEIEFKWRYSNLLVQAYRGEKDPRITSPTRCPAKYLFDGGTNTIVGQTILPYMQYKPVDIINASTIYSDDEKEAILLDNSIIENITEFVDVDVKQAMYDLMILRVYQNIPEDKRPIGPGSGLSLHLDAGVTDANTAQLINQSFNKRFNNPNASWDIGGYVSAVDGISYTYVKRLVDNMFAHMRQYSVNKPFTGKYTNIGPTEYSGFFPDIDTTDWELRELLYNSGGNAWIMDINGNLQRQSQRTLYRENGTSDLIQESNMRTLSQLCYLLQNKINSYLLEYNDDGVLNTLKDEVDNMFSNWVGNTVQDLEIIFKRDINPTDGGEIVVCYVNVTFRGLILRVPIIVNVQRRTTSE